MNMHTETPDNINVVSFRAKTLDAELERINRLTGLYFERMPTSLVNDDPVFSQTEFEETEDLISRAMGLWKEG